MKFRYQAPAGVQQVHVYGDWTYSVPEKVTCDGCGDGRLPYDWQPGDVAATQWRTIPMVLGADNVWEVDGAASGRNLPLRIHARLRQHRRDELRAELRPSQPVEDLPAVPGCPWRGAQHHVGAGEPRRSRRTTPTTSVRWPTTSSAPWSRSATLAAVDQPRRGPRHGHLHPRRDTTPTGRSRTRRCTSATVAVTTPPPGPCRASHTYIVQNAINEGAASEMLVVSTDFNGLPGGNTGYVNELRNNVIPYVEANYNVSTEAIDRAFAGSPPRQPRQHHPLRPHRSVRLPRGLELTPPATQRRAARADQERRGCDHDRDGPAGPPRQHRRRMLNRQAQLIAAGVDIDAYNVPGGTPAHLASAAGPLHPRRHLR